MAKPGETRIPEETSRVSGAALTLAYNPASRAVDIHWGELGEEPEYLYSMPWSGTPSVEELQELGQSLMGHVVDYASSLVEAYDAADVEANSKPTPATHNHMTRDIKTPGKCPACDQYWERHDG